MFNVLSASVRVYVLCVVCALEIEIENKRQAEATERKHNHCTKAFIAHAVSGLGLVTSQCFSATTTAHNACIYGWKIVVKFAFVSVVNEKEVKTLKKNTAERTRRPVAGTVWDFGAPDQVNTNHWLWASVVDAVICLQRRWYVSFVHMADHIRSARGVWVCAGCQCQFDALHTLLSSVSAQLAMPRRGGWNRPRNTLLL